MAHGPKIQNIFHKPNDGCCVYTVKDLSPPEETEEALQRKLEEKKSHGQYMEIAAVWMACRDFDPMGNKKVKSLIAIKAVSDHGSNEARDIYFCQQNCSQKCYSCILCIHKLHATKRTLA